MKRIFNVKSVSKKYNDTLALDNINFSLSEGEIVGILGSNGAGKTTLMRIIVGLTKDYEGKVCFEEDVLNKKIGCIIEAPNFYPYMTGYDNLEFFSHIAGNCDYDEIDELVKIVGLEGSIKKKVGKYSLGMKQRLGIARALLNKPKLLILDEPTNGLDVYGINEMREYLVQIAKEKKIAILVSSHNLSEIEKICNRTLLIQKGKIVDILNLDKKDDNVTDKRYLIKTDSIKELEELLKSMNIHIDRINKSSMLVRIKKEEVSRIIKEVSNKDISLYGIDEYSEELEEKFFDILGDNNNE